MKIGETRIQEFAAKQLSNDKPVKQEKTDLVQESLSTKESSLESKNASFVSDIKALNETMAGIGLAENSMQKINGDKMEEAVKNLRSITSNLKDILAKSFAATNENKEAYTADAAKAKLYGTNPSNLHNFDYLATKAASLLA